jgi:transcriptional regulator with XRE-family HTH domain
VRRREQMSDREPATTEAGPEPDFDAAALTYVRFILQELKLSPSALAKLAGISSSTLTRPLNNERHKFMLSTKTIAKLAAASGINPAPFFRAASIADVTRDIYYAPDVYDERIWGKQPENDEDRPDSTIIIGKVAAGVWQEPRIAAIETHMPLLLTSATYRARDCFAVYVSGSSINRVAKDGEVLFCIRTDAWVEWLQSRPWPKEHHPSWPYEPGDMIIIERRSAEGPLIELSARRIKASRAGWRLETESDDPRYAEMAIEITGDDLLAEPQIRVLGRVDYVIKFVPRADTP